VTFLGRRLKSDAQAQEQTADNGSMCHKPLSEFETES
jgi:hypothetical protein